MARSDETVETAASLPLFRHLGHGGGEEASGMDRRARAGLGPQVGEDVSAQPLSGEVADPATVRID